MPQLLMTRQGFLVLADLSGYTEFLNGTELDHAVETLRYLFNNLLEGIHEPFTISKLEGDAVFAFAPEGSFIQGQTFIDALEGIYFGYSLAWDRLNPRTDCDCNACQLTPKLELKFAAHFGAYALQDHGAYVELVGYDVNLVHRLMKNHVTEKTGLRAYAYLTEACVAALNLGDFTEAMQEYTESFDDVGEVGGYVLDLAPAYERRLQAERVYVSQEETGLSHEFDLPIPPTLAWDYLSEPDYQRQWRQDELLKVSGLQNGRMGVGTMVSLSPQISGSFASADELIADWKPTDYMTYRCLIPNANETKVRHLLMTELTPMEGGTHVLMRFGTPVAQNPRFNWLVWLAWQLLLKHIVRGNLKSAGRIIQSLVDEDIRSGKISPDELAPIAASGEGIKVTPST
jgi:hypothetical protein